MQRMFWRDLKKFKVPFTLEMNYTCFKFPYQPSLVKKQTTKKPKKNQPKHLEKLK